MLEHLRQWIGGTRTGSMLSSEAIRQRQAATEHRLTVLTTEAQDLALPEVEGDDAAATRRAVLHRQIDGCERERRTLAAALVSARAREHQTRQQEVERLKAELKQVLATCTTDLDAMLNALSAVPLPTVEEMTRLRLASREVSELEYVLEAHGEPPYAHLDALAELRSRMAERHGVFEHSWLRTRPTAKPDFSSRPWQRTVEALRRLTKEAA